MRFTLNWLKEYLDTDANLEEILDRLNQIGLEVEEYIDKATILKDFNVVEVVECENHPDSDHLHICKVKTCDGTILEIVCGAPNVRKNLKTILAPIGVKMPNSDLIISRSKIRGVYSNGMLCSEKELGISENHIGIIEIDNSFELGTNIAKILGIDDIIIDINITPNRGDCLGVYGIARDLSASGIGTLKPIKEHKINTTIKSPIKSKIIDENCPEFAHRYIKNVKNCESPDWMKSRLLAIGINPKSALVDITNYVMFSLNRPLHCYDADLIKGDFLIRKSQKDEKFHALNNKDYTLCEDSTLICDTSNNILGLGGIIGGATTAVSDNTKNIVLECAYFNPISIATTARKLNINTDAKYRFERNVDRLSTNMVINYTTYLINTICGGENSDIECTKINDYNEKIINFKITDVKKILGIEIEKNTIFKILTNLGYKIIETNNDIKLTVPSWRNDVTITENIVEDIIRIYGYDNIKEIQIDNTKSIETESNIFNKFSQNKLWEVSSYLASQGMLEVITWAFMDEKIANEFIPVNDNLKILNPIISDLSYMRPTIIPNLMKVAKYNQDRGIDSISIFEVGNIFYNPDEDGQKNVVSGIRYGITCSKSIFNDSRNYDIYDVKKDIFDILSIYDISTDSLIITNDVPKYYHPTRSGAIKLGNIILGVFGEIDPFKAKIFDLKHRVNAFELYLEPILKLKTKNIKNITQKKKFILNNLQPIYRDFAFIIDSNVEAQDIVHTIKKTNKHLITDVHIFDIYTGNGIDKDKKSIAFSIKIQPENESLTTEDINVITNKIIDELTKKFNAILRDEKL